MAGLDKEYEGEAFIAEGVKVGYLPQEPHLDATKNVFGNIMEGLAEKKALRATGGCRDSRRNTRRSSKGMSWTRRFLRLVWFVCHVPHVNTGDASQIENRAG